jgi:ssRNA-specific RNase YbeY (16S rRNA maturation enzyme)
VARVVTKAIFKKIKDHVLGRPYELSVAFVSPREMYRVTRRTKKRDKVSNVLAFPLSKNSGEILICKERALPYTVPYLFIHGLLHLRGHRHSARMESAERQIMKRFGISIT